MRRLHIIGRKNSGKTTLVVELVEYLSGLGHRVGTIKHTHHHHELDTPGKDSHRHRLAGARAVGVVSRGLTAVFHPVEEQGDQCDPYGVLAPSFAECDLVIVEGDSQTHAAKVEVWRAATGKPPLAIGDPSVHAVVTDDQLKIDLPVWERSAIASLAEHIVALCGNLNFASNRRPP